MIDLKKELDQCYLTDPNGLANPLWFIHDEFPTLKDWLIEPNDTPLYEIYGAYAKDNRLELLPDILSYIGDDREAEFNRYYKATSQSNVWSYETWLDVPIAVHYYEMLTTLEASHKQIVLYAALLHLIQTGYLQLDEQIYAHFKTHLLEAADEFRDEHTTEGIAKCAEKLVEEGMEKYPDSKVIVYATQFATTNPTIKGERV
jgi:hypothetical protein